MMEFFNYLVEVFYGLSLFGVLYLLFLKKETYFKWNRFFILGAIMISHILPLLEIPYIHSQVDIVLINLPEYVVSYVEKANDESSKLLYFNYLLWGYLFVSAVLLIRFLGGLFYFYKLKKASHIYVYKGLKIIESSSIKAPYSFLNYCFFPERRKLDQDSFEMIVEHEGAHIKLKHSYDSLMLELLLIFSWVNPILWVYRYLLKEVHEFEADRYSAENIEDTILYQQLLLKYVTLQSSWSFGNYLSFGSIKKRILMLNKNQSSKFHLLKYGLFFLATLLLVFVFSTRNLQQSFFNVNRINRALPDVFKLQASEKEKQDQSISPLINDLEEVVYSIVDKEPEFPGGTQALIKYLTTHCHYPETAKEAGIEGRCFYHFVVNADGRVSDIKVIRGLHPDIDAEGIRSIKAMPKWQAGQRKGKPVRVSFNLPIKWTLS